MADIRGLVVERYDQLEKCYGHCEQPATTKFLNSDADPVITGISCHSAYLSRIIIYSRSLELTDSLKLISQLLGQQYEVKEEDIRVASRYPWDLGVVTASDTGKIMDVAYWTQNYRRTKSEDADRAALFLCENCYSIYSQPLSSRWVLCPRCTSERQ